MFFRLVSSGWLTFDFFSQPACITNNLPHFLVAGSVAPGTNTIIKLNDASVSWACRDVDAGSFAVPLALSPGTNELELKLQCGDQQQTFCRTVKTVVHDPTHSTAGRRLLYVDVVSANATPALDGMIVLDLDDNVVLGMVTSRHVRGISPDGTEIYLSDRAVMSTASHQVQTYLPFSDQIQHNGFLVSSNGQCLYAGREVVTNSSSGYQLLTNLLPVSIVTGGGGPAISADGRWILCGTSGLLLVDTTNCTYTNTGIYRINLSDVAWSPDEQRILVSHYSWARGYLSVYDASSFGLVAETAELGDFAGEIAIVGSNRVVVGSAGNPANADDQRQRSKLTLIDLGSMNKLDIEYLRLADNLAVSEANEVFASVGLTDSLQGDRFGVDVYEIKGGTQLVRTKSFFLGINRFVYSTGTPRRDQISRIVYKPAR